MPGRSAAAEFTKVSEVVSTATAPRLPEAEALALAQAVEAQLARLPTNIRITDLETYRLVKESLPVLKRAEDGWTRLYEPIKAFFHKKWKKECDEEATKVGPLKKLRAAWSQEMYRFEQEQARIRREEEQRQAAEEKQRMEAAAVEEAAAISTLAPEMAEQIVEQALAAPAPMIVLPNQTAAVEVAGVNKAKPRYVWRYTGATDHEMGWKQLTAEQRKHVMALIPRQYTQPDESLIGALVTRTNGAIQIPGIEIYDVGSVTVRG